MEQATEAGATANSGHESVRTKRKWRPVIRRVAPAVETGEQNAAPAEATAAEVVPLISVWWDSLPGAENLPK